MQKYISLFFLFEKKRVKHQPMRIKKGCDTCLHLAALKNNIFIVQKIKLLITNMLFRNLLDRTTVLVNLPLYFKERF